MFVRLQVRLTRKEIIYNLIDIYDIRCQ